MNLKLKKAVVLLAFSCVAVFSFGKDIRLTKEKVQLEFKIPPLIELAPKEATYKFLYPNELTYFKDSEFSRFASGFNDVDGSISDRPRYFLPKRNFGNALTDYTFELIPSGVKYLKPTGSPYASTSYNNGFVQDFEYTFSCILKVYKKEQLVGEYVIDNGRTPYAETYFVNYRLEKATDQTPYVGFASAKALEQSIAKKEIDFMKFCFLIEYKTYRLLYEKACFTILNLFGDFNFKYSYPLSLVHEKDAAIYPEFNTHGTELKALLAKIAKFEDIAANADAYKREGDFFNSFSEKDGLDKDFRSAAQRNAALAYIFAGNEGRAFELIKKHDEEFRFFGSARSILFDVFNMCSAYNYYKNLPSGELVESVSLNDLFDREINEQHRQEVEDKRRIEEEKKRNEELEKMAFQDKLNKRNFIDVQAVINYKDKTKGYAICTFIFYKLDKEGEVDRSCGRNFSALNPPNEPIRCDLSNVVSIDIEDKKGNIRHFFPITIVQSPMRKVTTLNLFNENKLLELVGTYGNCQVYLDRTDPEDDSYVIVPLKNNKKGKGYRLSDIVTYADYPEWMKSNLKVKMAISDRLIDRNEKGAKKLCELIQTLGLPLEEL